VECSTKQRNESSSGMEANWAAKRVSLIKGASQPRLRASPGSGALQGYGGGGGGGEEAVERSGGYHLGGDGPPPES
jgi:hypothetical protein